MELVYLHGFATTPEIWGQFWKSNSLHSSIIRFPSLSFARIEAESQKLGCSLNSNTILVGWSMGGMVAIETALNFPEKIKGLVLLSTTPKFVRSNEYSAGVSETLLKLLRKRIKAGGIDAFHTMLFGDYKPAGLADLSIEQAMEELEELARIDLREKLADLKLPVLIIHGDQDQICLPEAAEFMRQRIADSQLSILPGVMHAPMIQAPSELKALIEDFTENA